MGCGAMGSRRDEEMTRGREEMVVRWMRDLTLPGAIDGRRSRRVEPA